MVSNVSAGRRHLRLAVLTCSLAVGLATWTALAEVGRLLSEIVVDSRSYGLSALFGPAAALPPWSTPTEAVVAWQSATTTHAGLPGPSAAGLLTASLVIDLVFIAAYVCAGWAVLSTWRCPTFAFIAALAVADFLEDVTAGALVSKLYAKDPISTWYTGTLHVLTAAKWVAAILVVLALVRRLSMPHGRARARRALVGVKFQRYSALAVLFLAWLGLSPGGDVSDQLPDVERSWGQHPYHVVWAVVALAILAWGLGVLGRVRTWRFHDLAATPAVPLAARPRPTLAGWDLFIAAALALSVAALSFSSGWVWLLLAIPVAAEVAVLWLARPTGTAVTWGWRGSDNRAVFASWSRALVVGVGPALLALAARLAGVSVS